MRKSECLVLVMAAVPLLGVATASASPDSSVYSTGASNSPTTVDSVTTQPDTEPTHTTLYSSCSDLDHDVPPFIDVDTSVLRSSPATQGSGSVDDVNTAGSEPGDRPPTDPFCAGEEGAALGITNENLPPTGSGNLVVVLLGAAFAALGAMLVFQVRRPVSK
jgi:hypothetical protein